MDSHCFASYPAFLAYLHDRSCHCCRSRHGKGLENGGDERHREKSPQTSFWSLCVITKSCITHHRYLCLELYLTCMQRWWSLRRINSAVTSTAQSSEYCIPVALMTMFYKGHKCVSLEDRMMTVMLAYVICSNCARSLISKNVQCCETEYSSFGNCYSWVRMIWPYSFPYLRVHRIQWWWNL